MIQTLSCKTIFNFKGEPGTKKAPGSKEPGQGGKEGGGGKPYQARETRLVKKTFSHDQFEVFFVSLNSYFFVSRFEGAAEGLPHTLKLIWRPPSHLATSSYFSHMLASHHLPKNNLPQKQPAIPPPPTQCCSLQLELIVAVGVNPVIVQHPVMHLSFLALILWPKSGSRFPKLPSDQE